MDEDRLLDLIEEVRMDGTPSLWPKLTYELIVLLSDKLDKFTHAKLIKKLIDDEL